MNYLKYIFLSIGILLFYSCKDEILPKPTAYLKLEYPATNYSLIETNCNYQFEKSEHATLKQKKNCWMELYYKDLKATVFITYRPIDKNLNEVLKEAEKLTFEHTIKADAINSQAYENKDKRVYGKLFYVEGNAASNLQFHLTDSSKHMITGALYFYSKPHYDSIVPAIRYLEKDLKHLMETFQWKKVK